MRHIHAEIALNSAKQMNVISEGHLLAFDEELTEGNVLVLCSPAFKKGTDNLTLPSTTLDDA